MQNKSFFSAFLLFAVMAIFGQSAKSQCPNPPDCGCYLTLTPTVIEIPGNGCGQVGNIVILTATSSVGVLPDTIKFHVSWNGNLGHTYTVVNGSSLTLTNLPVMQILVSVSSGSGNFGCSGDEAICLPTGDPFGVYPYVNPISCNATTQNICAGAYGGVWPYSYVWKKAGSNTVVSTEECFDAQLGTTYFVTVTDANGCTASNEIMTEVASTPPNINATVTQATCNELGKIKFSANNGTPGYLIVVKKSGQAGNFATSSNSSLTISNLTAGTYTAVVFDSKSCSDTVSATINPQPGPVTTQVFLSGCGNVPLPWGQVAPTPGVYEHVYHLANGCDSTVQAIVSSNTSQDSLLSVEHSCGPWTSPDGSVTLTQTGWYVQEVINGNGCPKRLITGVCIEQLTTKNIEVPYCYNSIPTAIVGGVEYHSDTTLVNFCETTFIVFSELPGPIYGQLSDTTICVAPSAPAGTEQVNVNIVKNELGCDSIIYWRNVTSQPTFMQSSSKTMCQGETYTWINGVTYMSQGVFTHIDSSEVCWKWYQLSVFVTQPGMALLQNTTCDKSLEGFSILPGNAPCVKDTVVYTKYLGVTNVVNLDSMVCFGNSLQDFIDTIPDPNGCLTERRWNIIQYLEAKSFKSVSVCANKLPYLGPNGAIWNEGTYEFVYPGASAYGCDSTEVVNLTIDQLVEKQKELITCDSLMDGIQLPVITILGVNGDCDTLLTITLHWVKPTHVHFNKLEQSCVPKLPFVETVKFLSVNGCDSLFVTTTTNFVLTDKIEKTLPPVTLCAGDTYFFNNVLYGPFNQGSVQTLVAHYTSVDGCDSIVYVNVFTLQQPKSEMKVTLCESENVEINGNTYFGTDGDQNFSFVVPSQVVPCDSLVQVSIRVVTGDIHIAMSNDTTVSCNQAIPSFSASAWMMSVNGDTVQFSVQITEIFQTDDCNKFINREIKADGPCGLSATENQIVMIIDTIAPVLIGVPANITISEDSLINVLLENNLVTATDCSDSLSLEMNFSQLNDSTYVRTWTATDNCGNVSAEQQIITLREPPVVVPPNDCEVLVLHDATRNPVRIVIGDVGEPIDITYKIYNSAGRVVVSDGSLSSDYNVEQKIPVAYLNTGTYYIKIWGKVLQPDGKRKLQVLKDKFKPKKNAWGVYVSE